MRLEQFYYVVEVAKSRSISRAAKQLFISQPSLSAAISNFEEELNTKIFIRSLKGVEPTENGKLIIDKAAKIVQTVEEVKQLCDSTCASGNITVSALPAVCNFIIFEVFSAFKKSYPQVEVMIKEDDNSGILQGIENGTVDIGVIGLLKYEKQDFLSLVKRKNYGYEELFHDELCIYAGKEHPLANKKLIYLQDVVDYSLITYKNNISNSDITNFEKLTKIKSLLRFTDRESIKKMVAQGNVLAFLPKTMSLNDIYVRSGHIAPLNIVDFKMPLAIMMVHNKTSYLPAMHREFATILKSIVNELIS